MAGKFCDWVPCEMLQKAAHMFLPDDYRPGEEIRFLVKDKTLGGEVRAVYFTYCPFCGVRIRNNPDVIDWVANSRR